MGGKNHFQFMEAENMWKMSTFKIVAPRPTLEVYKEILLINHKSFEEEHLKINILNIDK